MNTPDFLLQTPPFAQPTLAARIASALAAGLVTTSLLGGVLGLFDSCAPDAMAQLAVICSTGRT